MSEFWKAKIWGLLHDPALKALYTGSSRGEEGAWSELDCMQGWVSPKQKSFKDSPLSDQWLRHVGLCDLIASASDRAAIGRLPTPDSAIDYNAEGVEIRHLLSGASQTLKLGAWHEHLTSQGSAKWLKGVETSLIPETIRTCTDARKVYWWFWRCYPEILSQGLDRDTHIPNEPCLPLLPADTRIPDASVWSHTTMTSALAGSLAGYYPDADAYPKKRSRKNKDYYQSHPHVASFSFSPVQELIKASRKMRDFWAGSWLLHYLSAKVSWALAWKYGPDSLLYPCLYAQPLIDLWLLQEYPDFSQWIQLPSNRQLLTAGFPNVLVIILPDNGAAAAKANDETVKNPVEAAMQQAKQTLLEEWMKLGKQVLTDLQKDKEIWMRGLNPHTWDDWLKAQWQVYWTALPIGDNESNLHQSPRQKTQYEEWQQKQNELARPQENLFVEPEAKFLKASYDESIREDWPKRHQSPRRPPNLNVGSWWASIFDQTRFALNAVKNARTWEIPTAFGPRSTISGLGPVVHPGQPGNDWITEGDTANFWANQAGMFDGIEELNASEVLKRGLHKILTEVLFPKPSENREKALNPQEPIRLDLFYPDLSSGVAGWLRQMESQNNQNAIVYYEQVALEIQERFPWAKTAANQPWGIPWIASNDFQLPNPRLLNAGWLIEDFSAANPHTRQLLTVQEKRTRTQEELRQVREFISQKFAPGNNPTDWYILAAGDGDGMSNWLKGEPLEAYENYLPEALRRKLDRLPEALWQPFQDFIKLKKRMGPATHSALSRALLDFSNQLVPYLTEERYAGRLIYGGGDDVLAYTNLWEWDSWLWDIRQCFKGANDPQGEFISKGDYWRWEGGELPKNLSERPLFTMGSKATISFGITIAHHSVPMAIALENLWDAENGAKKHKSRDGGKKDKNAVQVRVLYGNGNTLKATAKFDVFNQWRDLVNIGGVESAIFEQAAEIWGQHPAPVVGAIPPWTVAFCSRREAIKNDQEKQQQFQEKLQAFIGGLYQTTETKQQLAEIQNWLKLAAFVLRNRDIKIGGNS
ncbi:type III-B CRISPR-associated protein Cas10/Cmr2 [[Phormidium] sp. ETS-05]|uniref:type III-B CRISPR-associated protein Cas10/Cmr2 n=1 Tax=[Phormidium] sp. ETS-05 TaxID=222819 RepID=UPI0018EF04DB|nr:type III-B CRISPR-associated protein Cas10/Cmr2 [[Phormidium] sp. ETS-05]